jgi:chromosome segregation ATPase
MPDYSYPKQIQSLKTQLARVEKERNDEKSSRLIHEANEANWREIALEAREKLADAQRDMADMEKVMANERIDHEYTVNFANKLQAERVELIKERDQAMQHADDSANHAIAALDLLSKIKKERDQAIQRIERINSVADQVDDFRENTANKYKAMYEAATNKLEAIQKSYSPVLERLHSACQRHKLGMAGNDVSKLVVDALDQAIQRAEQAEAEIDTLKAGVVALREALTELLDVQNGPPLETWRTAWEKAVYKGYELTKANHPGAALLAELARLREELTKISNFKLEQFMGPNHMALECVMVARDAVAQPNGGNHEPKQV